MAELARSRYAVSAAAYGSRSTPATVPAPAPPPVPVPGRREATPAGRRHADHVVLVKRQCSDCALFVRSTQPPVVVAAIAGALLGARWGVSAIPLAWQQAVNGWPHLTGPDLVRLAVLTARKGLDDADGWPSAARVKIPGYAGKSYTVQHPEDDGLYLGNLPVTECEGEIPIDAVVSLCRVGQAPIFSGTDVEHVRVWLVDKEGANANLHYVLHQAAREIFRLRQAGKRVFLHCVAGRSRTPVVAAAYSAFLGTHPHDALVGIYRALGAHWTLLAHWQMHDAVYELAGVTPHRPQPRPVLG
ncbi:dual specificity protein phosphatase family protein [Streptomyces sp. NPDC052236]|uniref:dual specificity protein phosphatase family protein n=1 Tax=Streptomyces sp. NPDC052236 TaxID=3365686 RepID=UPI0037D446E1